MKFVRTLLFLLSVFACTAQSETTPLWINLSPGDYDVGFKTDYLVDSSRYMPTSDSLPHAIEGRPIRIKIYYPGEKEPSSTRLLFLDQINIFPDNHQLAPYNAILNKRDRRLQGQFGPPSHSLKRVLFRTQTMAFQEIPAAKGQFPLLLYSLGLDDHQMENSVLWEYLASHGYVVAVLPSFGESLDKPYIPYTATGADLLCQDAAFVLNELLSKPYIDTEKVGVIGHSFGGIVATMLASREKGIKAIASLDGSVNSPRAQAILPELNIKAGKVNVPLLNLYTKAQGEKDLAFIKSLKSPVYQFAFNNASHFDFQNFGLYAHVMNTPDRRVVRMRSTEEGKDITLNTILLTKHFFNTIFFNDKKSEAFLNGELEQAERLLELASMEHQK